MEELHKLERMQRSLSSLESHGVSAGDDDSSRFLASFLLFMAEPFGALNVDQKYALITENLSKLSSVAVEGGLLSRYEKEVADDRADIGFDAMERANSTLEDFCRSYFMFHGMDVNNPKSIFTFLPFLSFTESYIYQLDTMNEKDLHPSTMLDTMNEKDLHPSTKGANTRSKACGNPLGSDLFGPLLCLLQYHGLVTERLKAELLTGIEYWDLEKKLCLALRNNEKIVIDDVMRAIHLKSFDYRVLNLLVYQMRGQKVNELHMVFLSTSEFLVEISDDLYDYEEDIIENSFNILRMFVRIYGPSIAPIMLAKCITEAEEKYENLSITLDPDLSSNYWKRCEEATKEGGKPSGYTLGAWSIPSIIVDEEHFRLQAMNSSS